MNAFKRILFTGVVMASATLILAGCNNATDPAPVVKITYTTVDVAYDHTADATTNSTDLAAASTTAATAVDLTALTATNYTLHVSVNGGAATDLSIGSIDSTSLAAALTSLNSSAVSSAGLVFSDSNADPVSGAKITLATTLTGDSASIVVGTAGSGTDLASALGIGSGTVVGFTGKGAKVTFPITASASSTGIESVSITYAMDQAVYANMGTYLYTGMNGTWGNWTGSGWWAPASALTWQTVTWTPAAGSALVHCFLEFSAKAATFSGKIYLKSATVVDSGVTTSYSFSSPTDTPFGTPFLPSNQGMTVGTPTVVTSVAPF